MGLTDCIDWEKGIVREADVPPILFFSKHFRGKGLQLCTVLPSRRIQTGLQASLRQEGFTIPLPFQRNLWQEQSPAVSLGHHQAMPANHDFLRPNRP